MSPFLLWQSAASKQTNRRRGERRMDGRLEALRSAPAAADEKISTEAGERRARRVEHESDLAQEPPPVGPREKAVRVPVVLDTHRTGAVADEDREVDKV